MTHAGSVSSFHVLLFGPRVLTMLMLLLIFSMEPFCEEWLIFGIKNMLITKGNNIFSILTFIQTYSWTTSHLTLIMVL